MNSYCYNKGIYEKDCGYAFTGGGTFYKANKVMPKSEVINIKPMNTYYNKRPLMNNHKPMTQTPSGPNKAMTVIPPPHITQHKYPQHTKINPGGKTPQNGAYIFGGGYIITPRNITCK